MLAGLAGCGDGSGEDGGDRRLAGDTARGDSSGGDALGGDSLQLSISSVSPNSGPLDGGLRVTISGTGFVGGTTVAFGANDASAIVVASGTSLQADTPAAGSAGPVTVFVRNPGGAAVSLPGGFTYYDGATLQLGWCVLQSPATVSTLGAVASEPIYGRAYVAGCSDGDLQCGALGGQLGYGPVDVDPLVTPGAWTWLAASYNPGHSADNNDEYQASLSGAAAGTWAYAYRFTIDGGASYTLCDLDGSDNGFALAQAGRWTRRDPRVDWCVLQYPASTSTTPGATSEPIFGRALVTGCSEGAQQCGLLRAQLGHGPADADPLVAPAAWTWAEAAYNQGHVDDDNDEYQTTLSVAQAGDYAYAYRFSVDDGASWRLCDRDSSDNGFSLAQAGGLTVAAPVVTIGWCNLQHPGTTGSVRGVPSEPIFGQVWVSGCSDGAARCESVLAQLGWAALGADAASEPTAFTWLPASYNPAHTGDDNDEYQATITPGASGDYVYAYRFSGDGGQTWTYCDRDGSANGFAAGQQGALAVADKVITWCNLQSPGSLEVDAGSDSEVVYGRVYVGGCSDGDARCGGLLAQVGYGPLAADPLAAPASYTWFPASYNPGHAGDDNDEYQGRLRPTASGSFRYAYRFSGDGGNAWSTCDVTGSDDGFSIGDLGSLTVR